jgi:hypothetical protein
VRENGQGRGRKNSLETNISRAKTDALRAVAETAEARVYWTNRASCETFFRAFKASLETITPRTLRRKTNKQQLHKKIGIITSSRSFVRPHLWSRDQSSWPQIQRSGFDFRRYQIF